MVILVRVTLFFFHPPATLGDFYHGISDESHVFRLSSAYFWFWLLAHPSRPRLGPSILEKHFVLQPCLYANYPISFIATY